MAVAWVQDLCSVGAANNTAAAVFTLSASPSAGNRVSLDVCSTTSTPTSVADSKGNTWTIDASGVGGTDGVASCSTIQDVATLASGDTVTVNFGSSQGHVQVLIEEWSGVDVTAAGIRATNGAAIASGTTRTSAAATAVAGDMVRGVFGIKGNESSFTAGTGYTATAAGFRAGTGASIEIEHQAAGSGGSYSPTATGGVSAAGYGICVIYKAASGGGATDNFSFSTTGKSAVTFGLSAQRAVPFGTTGKSTPTFSLAVQRAVSFATTGKSAVAFGVSIAGSFTNPIIQKLGTSGTAVMQKAHAGWTHVTGKTGSTATAIAQKTVEGWQKVTGH